MDTKSTPIQYPTDPEEYVLKAEIGRGAFATVYMAYCKSIDKDVAIKILDLDELDANWDEVRKEISIMGMLNHPNVVKYLCSFVVEREIWLVMPLMAGGSCADIMKRNYPQGYLDETLIATILKETLQGLLYFHKDGRIHRDVKAGNILISSEGEIQIADFGVAGTLIEAGDRKKARRTFVGTPCWMAPEVMEQTHGYDYKADIWSFGITALELAHGRPPYSQYQPMKVMLLTLQEPPPTCDVYEDSTKKLSKSFKDLVAKCLQKDPTKRPTAAKLLEHKFLKQAKNSSYVVESLLSKIPKPKWITCEATTIERLPKKSAKANGDSSNTWEFDDVKFQQLQQELAAKKALSPVIQQKGRFAVSSAQNEDESDDDALPEEFGDFVPIQSAPESKSVQKGRFTVKDH